MNAELRRLLWLEFGASRVGAVLLALGAMCGLGWLIDGEQLGTSSASFSLAAFVIFTVAWGAHQASRALLDELRARTWDQQRMSALTPWAMTWGKLLGATALPWLAGVLALLLHALATPSAALAWKLALCVGGALLVHTLSLYGALLTLQRGVQARSSLMLRALGSVLVGGIVLAYLRHEGGHVDWFGARYAVLPFTAVVVALLAAWTLFGCQRLMSEELQVRTQPWALPGFIVFVSLLGGGLVFDPARAMDTLPGLVAACAVAVGLAAAYFAAFALRNDPMLPRRLAVAARRRDWTRVGSLLPPWSIALVCAGVAALVVQIAWMPEPQLLPLGPGIRPLSLACVAVAVRDLLVIWALGISVREDRGELVALLYLALVHWLLPGIFALTGAQAIGALLTPVPWVAPARALAPLAVQAVAAAALAGWAYARRVRPLTAAAGGRF